MRKLTFLGVALLLFLSSIAQNTIIQIIENHTAHLIFPADIIYTDIGDNQSIENHLSTYSYRLKNMNYFLRKCDDRTLILIDEFGTGSDPELGGALAETFLEVFHEKGCFGIT